MNVQDLILTKEEVTPEPAVAPAPQAARKKSTVKFTVEDFDSGDFCIRRKTPRSEKLLVWLTSQTQFYIKDGKTNEVIPIEVKNTACASALAAFFRNWTEYLLPVFGLFHGNKKEKDAMCAFASILRFAESESNEKNASNMLKKLVQQNYINLDFGLNDPAECTPIANGRSVEYFEFYQSPIRISTKYYNDILEKTTIFTYLYPIYRKYYSDAKLRAQLTNALFFSAPNTSSRDLFNADILILIAVLGLDKTREYIDHCLALPYNDNSYVFADRILFPYYCRNSIIEHHIEHHVIDCKQTVLSALRHHTKIDFDKSTLPYTFDPDKFIEYAVYQRIREGQAFSSFDWFQTWEDTLRMEKQLFGKVKEKYPKNLHTYHNQISFLFNQKQAEIQEADFARRNNELLVRNWSDGKYIIRCPENGDDFLDEAHQQANCLASYVDAYSEGRTDIFFMRRVDDPEHSLVTIEVRPNGDGQLALRQAYRASNRNPSKEEMNVIHTWCDRFGIVFNSNYCPMCV